MQGILTRARVRLGSAQFRLLAVACVVSAVACSSNGSNGSSALIAVDEVPSGDDCANGGHQVDVGLDANGDGELGEDEIESTQFVCNGEAGPEGADGAEGPQGAQGPQGPAGDDGFSTLTAFTDLALYDENCPWSGVQVDAGLDNGEGDGTASDGILQSGEITSTAYVCEPKPTFVQEPTDPPEGDEGTNELVARGGEGTAGAGGQGGDFTLEMDYGSFGGHVKLFRTGMPDASFELPTVTVALGDVGVEVTSDTTVQGLDTGDTAGLSAGDLYTQPSQSSLLRWNGTSGDVVTGLHVAAGATLTFEPRFGTTSLSFNVTRDVHNEGTLATALLADGVSRANLSIDCGTFYGSEGSSIDLAGEDGGAVGGNGGHLSIDSWAADGGYADNGRLVNLGSVDTAGGDGETGGGGGNVSFEAGQGVHNTGAIDTFGGAGSVGSGGSAGSVDLYADYGYVANSADFDTHGGAGAVVGGSGGDIQLYLNAIGTLRNSGDFTTSGGDGASGGGSAGSVDLEGYSTGIVSTGDIVAVGGASTGASGGSGGDLYFYVEYNDGWEGEYNPAGDIEIYGNYDVSGGQGASGGSAGDIGAYMDAGYAPLSQEIVFYGYTDVDLRGGTGSTSGGNGGDFEALNDYSYADVYYYGPSGGVINYLDIDCSGGEGMATFGGSAGNIYMETDESYAYVTEGEVIVNRGNLTTRGGDGVTGGGDGDAVWLWGYNMVDNTGDLDSSGGAASGDGASGGDADYINLISELGPSMNTGSLTASGGDALGANAFGGDGDDIEMLGQVVLNEGAVDVSGGDANDADGVGGDGGFVSFFGHESETSLDDTTASLAGGVGDTPGEDGIFYRDGFNATATF